MSYQPQANGHPRTAQTAKIALNKNVGRTGLKYLPDFFVPTVKHFHFQQLELNFLNSFLGGGQIGVKIQDLV